MARPGISSLVPKHMKARRRSVYIAAVLMLLTGAARAQAVPEVVPDGVPAPSVPAPATGPYVPHVSGMETVPEPQGPVYVPEVPGKAAVPGPDGRPVYVPQVPGMDVPGAYGNGSNDDNE